MDSRGPKFYAELKTLNEQFVETIKRYHEKSAYYDFSPLCSDYISLFQDIQQAEPTEQNDDDQDPVPVPEIETYDEPNAKLTGRCKLYIKTELDNKLDLLGVGRFFVKDLDGGKKQLIVRQEPDYRKVLLNQSISLDIPVKLRSKAVQILFPHALDGSNASCLCILKVKDEAEAKTFYDTLKT